MRRTGPARPRAWAARRLAGSPTVRLQVGFLLIAMVLSVFAARLVQLQGVDPNSYAQMAADEGMVDVILPAERGDILDRNGEPLADSVDGLMVVADPPMTADRAPEIAKFLSTRLQIDYFSTLERLRVEDSRFQYIARQVPASLANVRGRRRRGEGLRGPRHPAGPGADLPGPRRGGQPGRLPRHPAQERRRQAAGRTRGHASTPTSPAPTARRGTRSATATGSRSATAP